MSYTDILKANSITWFENLDESIDDTFSDLLDNRFYRPVELVSLKGATHGFLQFEIGKEDPEQCFGCLLGEGTGIARKSWHFVEGERDLVRHIFVRSKDELQQFKSMTNSLSFAGESYRQQAKRLDKVLSVLQFLKANPFTNDPSKAARVARRMIRYAHERVAYLKQCLKTGYRPKTEVGMLSRVKSGLQSSKCIRIIDGAAELENYSTSLTDWVKRFTRLEGMTKPAFYKTLTMNPYSIRTRPGLSFIIKKKLDFLSTIEYDEDNQTVRFCLFDDFQDFADVAGRKLPAQEFAVTRKQITVKSERAVCGLMIPSIIQWLEKIAAHPFVDDPNKAAGFARRALLFVAVELQSMLGELKLWDEFFSSLVTENRSLFRIPRIEPKAVREMRWTINNQSLFFSTRVGLFLVENSFTESKPTIPEDLLEKISKPESNESIQISVLKQKLADAQSEVRNSNRQVARLTATIQGKNEQIEESENVRRKLKEELATLQIKTADKTEQYEQLKSEVDGVLQENLALGENKERQSDVIDAQKRHIAELESTVKSLLEKGNIDEALKSQVSEAHKLRTALQNVKAELTKVRAEKNQAEETIRKLSESYADLRKEASAGRSQLDVPQKVAEANDGDADQGNTGRLLRPLIFGEAMSATDSLKLIEAIFPDRVAMQETAWESAAAINSSFSQGKELTKTLFLLVTDYLDAYLEAGDGKARTVFGSKYSAQESERVQKDPKFARERTFAGVVMQQHLKIGYSERLYFKVDVSQKKVIIGYCGKHLPIVTR